MSCAAVGVPGVVSGGDARVCNRSLSAGGRQMDPLPDSAPLATRLRNTLVQYHSIGDGDWRLAKKTVSGLGSSLRAARFLLSREL